MHYRGRLLGRQRKLWIALAVCLSGIVVLLAASSPVAARSPAKAVRLDRTFGDNGQILVLSFGNPLDNPLVEHAGPVAVVAEPSGRIIVALGAYQDGYQSGLAAYTSTGAVDPNFGQGGLAIIADATLGGAAKQPDGKIVLLLTGRCGTCAALYDANGMQDLGFGTGGLATLESAGERLQSPIIAIAPDAKTVVAALVGTRGKRQGAVVRLNPDGSADTNFGQGGQTRFSLARSDRRSFGVGAVDVQKDGDILVGGHPGAIYRVKSNGVLDNSFGRRGRVASKVDPSVIKTQPNGKVLVGGTVRSYACRDGGRHPVNSSPTGSVTGVARYFADGRKDRGFGNNGFASLSRHNCRFSEIVSLFVQKSGEIIAGGDRYYGAGDEAMDQFQNMEQTVAGFTRSGERDMRFGPQGMASFQDDLFPSLGMAKQEDGKMLMVSKTFYDEGFGLSRFNIGLTR